MEHLKKYGIETRVLSNGFKIVLKRLESPRIYAGLIVACGPLHEPAEKRGISHFLEHLVGEEGKIRNANSRLLYKIARDGGDMDQETGEQYTVYELNAVSQFWYRDLKMFLNLIAELNFSKDNFFNEQARVTAEIAEDSAMDIVIRGRLFGNHRLSCEIYGTKDSVALITPQDICGWHRKFYRSQMMMLVIVGDVEMGKVARAVRASKINSLEDKEKIEPLKKIDLNWEAKSEVTGMAKNVTEIIFPLPPSESAYDNFLVFILNNYIFNDTSIIALDRKVVYEMGLYEPLASSRVIIACCSYFKIDLEAPSHKAMAKLERRFSGWIKWMSERGFHRDVFRRICIQRAADMADLSDNKWFELLKASITEGYFGKLELYLEPEYLKKDELERVFRECFGGRRLVFRNFKNK